MPKLRKIIIQISMTLQTGIDYLQSLSIFELLDIIKEVSEIVNDRKRVQAGGKNSW